MKRFMRRRVVLLAAAAVGAVVIGGTALAGPAGAVKTFTGCLASNDGTITKVKEGDSPKSSCSSGQTVVKIAGGDITKISVTAGLTLPNQGESGDVTIGLDSKYTLPQSCTAPNVVPKWNGTAWACAPDNDTTYSAGTGLDLGSNEFSVEEGYRLPQTCASGEAATRNPATGGGAATWICDQYATADQSCTTGQFANGVTALGTLACAAPAASGGTQVYSTTTTGAVTLAGRTSVLSKTLPAGKYILFAAVELINRDLDSESTANCDMPGYATGPHDVDEAAEAESLFLMSTIDHSSGSVLLACTETVANVDVDSATLVAIKVDSLG
jgi:hypothetical protein